MNDMTIESATLPQLEREFEGHLVRGTGEYVAAWLTLAEIRDSEAWRGSLTADGAVPQTFDEYVRDLVDRVKDRNTALPISRSTVFYNLRWLRRSQALQLPPETVLAAPPSVMNQLSKYAEWDSRTGEITSVRDDRINEAALPGDGNPIDRFRELVADIVHSDAATAHHRLRGVRRDYSDEFEYAIMSHQSAITSVRCCWTVRADGEMKSATWHDILRDRNLPQEVMDDFKRRLLQ